MITSLSSADREWRALARQLVLGQIPRHSTYWVLVELSRLNRKALRQEAYHRRQAEHDARLAAELADLEPNPSDAYHWSPDHDHNA